MTDVVAPTEQLARSVKREDFDETGRAIWVFRADYQPAIAPYDLPIDVVLRDDWLRASVKLESMWASAVAIAGTKVASRSYEVESSVPLRAARAQDLFLGADVKGWVRFISKLTRDYLTTNNGAFVEIVRASGARGARITGINHLDSRRCRRTGDLEVPVVYMDLKGKEHELRWYEVIDFVDQPDPAADKLGMGMCAAHRAWKKICYMAAVERYIWEKASGAGATSIEIIGGVSRNTIKDGVDVAKEEKQQEGFMMYMGKLLVPINTDTPITLVSIPLKDLPDGFDPEQERQEASIVYSNAIGLDTQDLRPLTGQALGTGAQSQVLDTKAEGRGLAAFVKDMTHQFGEMVLDAETSMVFIERDYRDEKLKAEVSNARAQFVNTLIQALVITPEQGLQLLADHDEIPQEFVPVDQTSSVALDDEEKPQEGMQAGAMPALADGQPVPTLGAQGQPQGQMGQGNMASTPVALNGAQVTAALGIVSQVAAGNIPRETGINSLITFFALTPEQAERVMGSAGQGFTPDQEAAPVKMPASGGGSATAPSDEDEKNPNQRTKAAQTVTPRGSTVPPVPSLDAIIDSLPALVSRAKSVWDATMEEEAGLLDAEELGG